VIAIVDYGMGNIRSVEKGFLKIRADVKVTADPTVISNSKGIVLPGVGAFRDCMANLERLDLLELIKKEIGKGKPYLGICLGLQILFSESEEFGLCKGMNLFRSKVRRFRFDTANQTTDIKPTLKIPHMGWNNVKYHLRPPIFDEIPDNSFFYFVHSYYVSAENQDIVAATTNYGIDFASVVWRDNIFATQFHPEKSQQLGIKVLKGFNKICEHH
jgi:glutamine amidotransferase